MSDTMVAERDRQGVSRNEDRQAQSGASRQEVGQRSQPAMAPRVDVLEDASGITVLADLPGVSRDALEINVEGDSLTIEGQVSAATPEAMEATYAEIRVPRYRRSFTLSRELDTGRIEAQLKDGVLRLRIPKQEQAQPRRISIKAG
jgi:HSP20 family molecular chaperone IbpA